ncbi:MAG TPA: NrdJb [Methylococcaceae bacterium]|nr:NrdJb [Methylococcaceae bacterium]
MSHKITQKIVGYKVVNKEEQAQLDTQANAQTQDLELMHETLKRPEVLFGTTYKIKTPQSEHAMYITINDMVLNAGTEFEERHPYEIFINSKNMEHFQWVLALTRLISAVWRKGGDACFLVDELKGVFDPKGGYFKKGGVYMPSLVAEIGCAIESHLKRMGIMKGHEMEHHQKAFLETKRQEFEASVQAVQNASEGFPEQASLCGKCHVKAAIVMDGCVTCLNCGESKCG